MMVASIVLPRPTSSARMARPPMSRSTRWATSIWWGSSLIALASSVINRSKPGTSAIRSASRRSSYQARSAEGPRSCSANALSERSSTDQTSSAGVGGIGRGDGVTGSFGLPTKNDCQRSRQPFELPLLGSNQDSPDPESGVLPVTPRGSDYGAEGARTPDLLGAIQALSQLTYSPVRARNITSLPLFSKQLGPARKSREFA